MRTRVQLSGLLAVKGMAQFGNEVILTLGLGAQTHHFRLHGQKRLSHGRRKRIQIKGWEAGANMPFYTPRGHKS